MLWPLRTYRSPLPAATSLHTQAIIYENPFELINSFVIGCLTVSSGFSFIPFSQSHPPAHVDFTFATTLCSKERVSSKLAKKLLTTCLSDWSVLRALHHTAYPPHGSLVPVYSVAACVLRTVTDRY